jgi:hypothetical protein
MFLLTSVLDSQRLDRQAMGRLYAMRWGIEIEFRGLKQTLKKSKLRCRTARRLYAELNWSIMALAVAELFATKEQIAASQSSGESSPAYRPKDRSLANTMRAIYNCLDELNEISEAGTRLADQLRSAMTDDYVRQSRKAARYRPKNPDKKKLGDPQVRKVNPIELKQIKKHNMQNAA